MDYQSNAATSQTAENDLNHHIQWELQTHNSMTHQEFEQKQLQQLDLLLTQDLSYRSKSARSSVENSVERSQQRQIQSESKSDLSQSQTNTPSHVQTTQTERLTTKKQNQTKNRNQKYNLIESYGKSEDRMLRLYPHMLVKDKIYTEFSVKNLGQCLDEVMDPSTLPYQMPDFGFNTNLAFEEFEEGLFGWRKFMDCVSVSPRFERVQNYIQFINDKKWQQYQKSINKKNPISRQSILNTNELIQNQRNLALLKEQGNYKTKKTEVVDPSLNMSKHELRIRALNKGILEVKQIVYEQDKFIEHVQKKNDRLVNYENSDDEHQLILPKISPKRRKKAKNAQVIPAQDANKFTFTDWNKIPVDSVSVQQKATQILKDQRQKSCNQTPRNMPSQLSTDAHNSLSQTVLQRRRPLPVILKLEQIKNSFRSQNSQLSNTFQTLRQKLLERLEEVIAKLNEQDGFDEVEIQNAYQGLQYLRESRMARINPYVHLSILINSKHLTADQVAQNAKLMVQLASKQHFQVEMCLDTKFDGYRRISKSVQNIKSAQLPNLIKNQSFDVDKFKQRNGLGSKKKLLYFTQQETMSQYTQMEVKKIRQKLESKLFLQNEAPPKPHTERKMMSSYYEPKFIQDSSEDKVMYEADFLSQ